MASKSLVPVVQSRHYYGMENSQIIYALIGLNVVTYLCFAFDKWSAKRQGWRIPEANLLLLAFLGGSPAALLGMFRLRHKTRKIGFRILLPFFFMLHLALAGLLLAGYDVF